MPRLSFTQQRAARFHKRIDHGCVVFEKPKVLHSGLLVAAEEQRVGLPALANYPMVLPSAPNAIRHLLDSVLGPRHIELQVLAEVGAVHTVLALVATGVGCTILPESAVAAIGDEALPRAPIGPPSIWNALLLATPMARPATRLTRGTAQLLQELDFRHR